MKTIIEAKRVPHSPYFSQAVVAGGFAFVSGMTGVDPETGGLAGPTIRDQAAQALRNCESTLNHAGISLRDVVEVQALLARHEDFAAFNQAYAPFFPVDPPARSVARLGVEIAGVLVSVRMVAVAPYGSGNRAKVRGLFAGSDEPNAVSVASANTSNRGNHGWMTGRPVQGHAGGGPALE